MWSNPSIGSRSPHADRAPIRRLMHRSYRCLSINGLLSIQYLPLCSSSLLGPTPSTACPIHPSASIYPWRHMVCNLAEGTPPSRSPPSILLHGLRTTHQVLTDFSSQVTISVAIPILVSLPWVCWFPSLDACISDWSLVQEWPTMFQLIKPSPFSLRE